MKTFAEESKEITENLKLTHPEMMDIPKVVVPAVLSKKSQEVKEWLEKVGFPSPELLEKLNQK